MEARAARLPGRVHAQLAQGLHTDTWRSLARSLPPSLLTLWRALRRSGPFGASLSPRVPLLYLLSSVCLFPPALVVSPPFVTDRS